MTSPDPAQEAPACVRGNGIWNQHDIDWRTMRCRRCGWEMPQKVLARERKTSKTD